MAQPTHSVHLELSGEAFWEFFNLLARANVSIEGQITHGDLAVEIWKAGIQVITKNIEGIENEQRLC